MGFYFNTRPWMNTFCLGGISAIFCEYTDFSLQKEKCWGHNLSSISEKWSQNWDKHKPWKSWTCVRIPQTSCIPQANAVTPILKVVLFGSMFLVLAWFGDLYNSMPNQKNLTLLPVSKTWNLQVLSRQVESNKSQNAQATYLCSPDCNLENLNCFTTYSVVEISGDLFGIGNGRGPEHGESSLAARDMPKEPVSTEQYTAVMLVCIRNTRRMEERLKTQFC